MGLEKGLNQIGQCASFLSILFICSSCHKKKEWALGLSAFLQIITNLESPCTVSLCYCLARVTTTPSCPPSALFPHFPSLAWPSALCTEPEVGGDLCSWVAGSLEDSCRDESVGLWRGDGSGDSLTLGRTKEGERKGDNRSFF